MVRSRMVQGRTPRTKKKAPARISRGTSSSTPTLAAKHGEGQMRSRRTVEDPAQVYSR